MPDEYTALAEAMKALAQDDHVLPVAEDGWNTRPDAESYGIIALEFEPDSLDGDDGKRVRAYEGSADLYSRSKTGAGWIPLIEGLLAERTGSCWRLNHHAHERETGLYHWEWVFQVEG